MHLVCYIVIGRLVVDGCLKWFACTVVFGLIRKDIYCAPKWILTKQTCAEFTEIGVYPQPSSECLVKIWVDMVGHMYNIST